MTKKGICVTVLAASLGFASFARGAPITGDPNFFPIGIFQQPVVYMDRWKARGVNTLVGADLEGYRTIEYWNSQAEAKGMYQIRQPLTDPKVDVGRKSLLAWMQYDEPDVHNTSATVLASQYATWKKIDPNRKVFVNYSGRMLLSGSDYGDGLRQKYVDWSKGADWVSGDIYPVTGYNRPDWLDRTKPSIDPRTGKSDRRTSGAMVTQLRNWVPNKNGFGAFIETSDQDLSWTPKETRGINAAEFKGSVWDALIHGANSIFYFAHKFGVGWPAGFDGTPADVVAEMTKQNDRIVKLALALNADVDPSGYSFSSDNGLLQGSWRKTSKGTFFIVENMSSSTLTNVSFDLQGVSGAASVFGENRTLVLSAGLERDSFTPYETHVYQASGSVPEPGIVGMAATALLIILRRRKHQNS